MNKSLKIKFLAAASVLYIASCNNSKINPNDSVKIKFYTDISTIPDFLIAKIDNSGEKFQCMTRNIVWNSQVDYGYPEGTTVINDMDFSGGMFLIEPHSKRQYFLEMDKSLRAQSKGVGAIYIFPCEQIGHGFLGKRKINIRVNF